MLARRPVQLDVARFEHWAARAEAGVECADAGCDARLRLDPTGERGSEALEREERDRGDQDREQREREQREHTRKPREQAPPLAHQERSNDETVNVTSSMSDWSVRVRSRRLFTDNNCGAVSIRCR